MWFTSSSGRIELKMTLDQARSASQLKALGSRPNNLAVEVRKSTGDARTALSLRFGVIRTY